MKISIVGIAWFREDQWQRMVGISDDKMSPTYQEWLNGAEKTLEHINGSGQRAIKVGLEADELLAWCADKNMPVNSKARISLVNQKLAKMVETGEIKL